MASCSGLGPTVRLALGRWLESLVDCRAKVPSITALLYSNFISFIEPVFLFLHQIYDS